MKKIGQVTKTALQAIPQKAQLREQSKKLEIKKESVLKIFPDAESFSVNMNLDVCMEKYAQYKTCKDALTSGKIKIRELAAIYGDRPVVGWLSTWLISIASIMDFEISNQQRKATALMLVEELYMLNMAEITLFFKRLQKGRYGIFYNKFNMQTILVAAKEFRNERGRELSKLSDSEIAEIIG